MAESATDLFADEQGLAPYAMRAAGSRGRLHPEQEHPYRTCFQRDRDRIVHCTAFRRLEYKTQVFVNHEGDHYRTRLTHTIEVSHVARALARALALNEDLAETVALSHDIGHPPFGHSGEDALERQLKDHGGFNHNRHALRVFDHLESRYPDFPGLNLSYEVRESAGKHGAPPGAPWLAEFHPEEGLLLEAHVADLSDSIAYDSHDVEDALNAGLVDESIFTGLRLWDRAAARIPRFPELAPHVRRYQMKRTIIDLLITDAMNTSRERIAEAGIESVADVRAFEGPAPLIGNSPEVAREKKEFEAFMYRTSTATFAWSAWPRRPAGSSRTCSRPSCRTPTRCRPPSVTESRARGPIPSCATTSPA
jgi:dGTPase